MKAQDSVKNFYPTLRMYTNFAVRTIRKVCAEIGPREAGTQAELDAQNYMAKAVGEKFDEDLEMEKRAFGYSAKFKRDVPQKLSIDIVSVDGSGKKKIVITFVDKVVELD